MSVGRRSRPPHTPLLWDRPEPAPRVRVVESTSAAARLAAAEAFLAAHANSRDVILVAPSRGAADDLARQVVRRRGALLGVHRFGFTQLAARLAASALLADGRVPSSALGVEAVAARSAFEATRERALSYFEPVARTPGFPRALARTLSELRLARVGAGPLEPLGGPASDLAELLLRFEGQFEEAAATDRAALFAAATAGLAREDSELGSQPLVLVDVPAESRAEREFLLALARRDGEVLVVIPTGDLAARDTWDALAPLESVEEDGGPEDLRLLRRRLFGDAATEERTPSGELLFYSAPGEGREAVEVARRVLDEARRGVPFDEMAIFLRAPQQYLGLLEHALQRAGVPVYFDRGTRRPDPAGRAFIALIACAADKLSAKRFAEYLSLGQVPALEERATAGGAFDPPADEALASFSRREFAVDATDDRGGETPSGAADEERPVVEGSLRAPWRWEDLLVESAVIGGRDRWRRRLDGLFADYNLRIRALRAEEPESPRLRRLERDVRDLQHLRDFALPIIDTLAGWPAEATWGEWIGRFTALAPLTLRRPARVLRVLADLRPMSDIGPIPIDEARDVLSERLRTLEAEPPARRFGQVFVGSPHQARGRSFRVVFVVGLAERLFPQKIGEDPLLLDELRQRLATPLPMKHDRSQLERLLLRLVVGAATERIHVSFPRLELAESRPRVPSFYALDIMRAVRGRVPHHEELEREASEAAGASLSWPAPNEPERAIDDLEHDLATLRQLFRRSPAASRGRGHYLLQLNEPLRRSVSTRWLRSRQTWSPADGLVRVTDITRPVLATQRLAARPYSLSALQRYAVCPYQFFLAAIARLEPAERPEPLQRMDPLTRGSLFHDVQAAFFRRLSDDAALPVKAESLSSALIVLEAVLEGVAAEYREQLAPAIDRVWQDEVAEIRKDLHLWVQRLPEATEWQPAYFEFSFGLSDEGRDRRSVQAPVQVAGRFLLRGAVDLIEEHRGAGDLRVTDHKTGRNRTMPNLVIGGGAVLQPVLYGLAVEQALGRPVRTGRLFYCTGAGGFTEREIPLNDRARQLGIEALEIVDRAVELGALPPAPSQGACAWCDFLTVCGQAEPQRIDGKQQDLLADLLALRERP